MIELATLQAPLLAKAAGILGTVSWALIVLAAAAPGPVTSWAALWVTGYVSGAAGTALVMSFIARSAEFIEGPKRAIKTFWEHRHGPKIQKVYLVFAMLYMGLIPLFLTVGPLYATVYGMWSVSEPLKALIPCEKAIATKIPRSPLAGLDFTAFCKQVGYQTADLPWCGEGGAACEPPGDHTDASR